MNTGAYDNGRFWYITDANPSVTLVGAAGLVFVAVCYFLVILKMLLWRNKLIPKARRSKSVLNPLSRMLQVIGPSYDNIQQAWTDLTSYHGKNRKRWNAFLKLVDLAMETVMLRQLLQSGSPVSLTYGFAGFIAFNSLSCIVNVLTDRFSALMEIFIDSIFDLAAAVLFPILTLVYCYYNFDFDRAAYLTYLEKLPLGSFEHNARSFADPSEIALFRVNFDSLRINSSVLDFVLRISMNLTFCYRFERVMVALNPVPKAVTAVFIAISLIALMSTNKAITDSESLCSPHPECVVYAHQWETNNENCPCLILIDIDLSPKYYDEWIYPVNAYDKVTALAASGMLTSLQVINRQLLELPEAIRNCRGLKTIHLMYTSIEEVPVWIKELQNLETIHIEGKYGSQNLRELPDDLFSNLPQLSTIHLGVHLDLKRIPPFSGVPHLQSVSLAWLTQLYELPALDHVPELSRLLMSIMPRLESIPDLSHLRKLVEFVILRPSTLCCNGFTGPCDLDHVSCRTNPVMKTTTTTCLKSASDPSLQVTPFRGSAATKTAFEAFSAGICQDSVFDKVGFLIFPTKETIDMCGGKPFRQCFLPGNITGICYNTRFQVLSCVPDANYIELRRVEIKRGIGPKCDVAEEEWIGCTA
eukprot:jgi/Phyca11/125643/e_gw1.59.27.1